MGLLTGTLFPAERVSQLLPGLFRSGNCPQVLVPLMGGTLLGTAVRLTLIITAASLDWPASC
jgi:hypothetical protein